jgi:hypothetical protein
MNDTIAHLPREAIALFCHRWKISELAIFGSALGEGLTETSDLDFLVTFDADARHGLLANVKMQQELEQLVHRRVDLVSKRALMKSSNWIRRKAILDSANILYAEKGGWLAA